MQRTPLCEAESDSEDEEDAKFAHNYVLTSPPASVKLNPSDKLYVIATTDWAWVNVPVGPSIDTTFTRLITHLFHRSQQVKNTTRIHLM